MVIENLLHFCSRFYLCGGECGIYAKKKVWCQNTQKVSIYLSILLLDKVKKKVYNNITVERGEPRERVKKILLLLCKESVRREEVSEVHSGRKAETSRKTF